MYLEKLKLDGKVAVVTGGGRAIGLACCTALAEAGATVVIADVDPAVAASGQADLRKLGFHAETVQLDVTKSRQVTEVADKLVAKHGHVDILVNNAGIARSGTAGEEVSDEQWLNVNDVNYNGVFWCCRAFGRHMLKRAQGRDRQHRLDVRLHRQPAAEAGLLQRLQGGGASPDRVARGRMGRPRRARQRGGADLYRDADGALACRASKP